MLTCLRAVSAIVAIAVLLPQFSLALDRAQAVDILKSVHDVAVQTQQISNVRRLQQLSSVLSDAPFVTTAQVNASECLPVSGMDCTFNGGVLLTNSAPDADTDMGKFLAKTSAIMQLCSQHATASACLADTTNGCTVYTGQYSATNTTIVESCGLSPEALVSQVAKFGVCPGSLADDLFACSQAFDLLSGDSPSGDSCSTRNGGKCKALSSDICFPAALEQVYDLTKESGANKLQSDIKSVSTKFWGCCAGRDLLRLSYTCTQTTTTSACTSNKACYWNTDDDKCFPTDQTVINAIADTTSPMGTYLGQARTKCNAFKGDAKTCSMQPAIKINQTRTAAYAKSVITPGGSAGCSTTKPGNSATALLKTVVPGVLGTALLLWFVA